MRSERFEAWFADRNDLSLQVVANMWRGGTYKSCDYLVELAWAAWCEAINGVRD